MISALWTGIAGLSSQQTALDNESNNIANVNTVGYKASRVSFADLMYQDSIGKGASVTNAEKQYTQGSLNLTGSSYDVALSGDGFFVVSNKNFSGTSENYYTRAGNFRMGENGTLQDAAGNEVQGWAINAIDATSDVTSTNSNLTYFTDLFTEIAGNQIIQFSNKIETYAAKMSDYTQSVKSDSNELSGSGIKTKSTKISDIEALISNYSKALESYAQNPEQTSSPSFSQTSIIDYPNSSSTMLNSEGDQIYIYIDGNKITQNYISTSATEAFKTSLLQAGDTNNLTTVDDTTTDPLNQTTTITPTAVNNTRYELTIGSTTVYYDSDTTATTEEILDGLQEAIEDSGLTGFSISNDGTNLVLNYGNTTPTTSSVATYKSNAVNSYDVEASRVATYKALADQISNITGLKAYTVDSSNNLSTSNVDILNGTIKIDSIIPGDSFTLGDLAEVSGTTEQIGTKNTLTDAVQGSGEAAVKSAMEALRNMISGNQQDVYESSDILSDDNSNALSFNLGDTISYTINGTTIITDTTNNNYSEALEDLITKINSDATLQQVVEAKNINGKLVIESKNAGEEFSGILVFNDGSNSYTKEKNSDSSGNTGADAEFMQIITTLDQTSSKSSLQLKLDTLGLTDSSFGEFSVDDSGVITMTQDGIDYVVGQLAIAQFNNNIGLEAVGDNLLAATNESGTPIYAVNNNNGTSVESKTLELSTADLSESLVNLMVFQRAFEANAKSITTADEILNTLINLKR